MRIDASGNLLVGTTSGTGRIVVRAAGADSADSTVMRLAQENYNTGGASLIKIGTEGNGWSKGAIGFVRTGDFDTGALIFAVNGSSNSDDVTSANERMRIDSSGNVGIGASPPSFPLSIQSNSSAEALLILGRSADDIGEIAFRENDNSTALGELQYRQDHAILRHRVGDLRFATGGTLERMRIPLVFGTANTERMRIDASGNVGIGTSSPANVTSGNGKALLAIWGFAAGDAITSGDANVAVGTQALSFNTTADNNTAVGYQAGYSNTTTASENTAVGYQSLYSSTGTSNGAFGWRSLYSNTTGIQNVGLGYRSGYLNTTGSYNTAIGFDTLYSNTTASNNTAVGYQALYANTGNLNTAVGDSALKANTSGVRNTAIGKDAMLSNTTGGENVAMGRQAMRLNNTTGGSNVAIGP
jgi:hypothetical protein